MSRDAQGTNNEVLTVNKTQLLSIQMVNFPEESQGIQLIYATGYEDGEGVFQGVKRGQLAVPPADFAAFAASDLGGQGFFAALKDWCYTQIAAQAVV